MQPNIGSFDRALRFVAGLIVLGGGIYYRSPWGFLGLLLLATAAFRFCPAYLPFGLNTCAREKDRW